MVVKLVFIPCLFHITGGYIYRWSKILYKYPSHPIYKCLVISHYNWPSTGARWLLQSHEFFSVPSHGGVPQNAGPQNHWSPPGKGTEKSIGQYKRIHKNAGMSTHVHHEIHPYASRPCFDHGAHVCCYLLQGGTSYVCWFMWKPSGYRCVHHI